MAEKKRFSLFGPAKVEPVSRNNKDRERDFLEAMERLQRIEIDNQGKKRVLKPVYSNDPIEIVIASDWHLGSIATDMKEMLRIRDYILDTPNAGVVFAGDELEGLKAQYLSTNTAKTPVDVQIQIEFLKMMFFDPLAEQGKVLGMVSGYWGHPGWVNDATTLNIWRTMVGDLDIPIVQNGGFLDIKFPSGYVHSLQLWHNPPGNSKYDEVAGLREAILGTSESVRPDGAISGHIHRMGVAKENYAGAINQVYYISAGTLKGSNPDLPRDAFGERLGAPDSHPQGQGVVIQPKVGRRAERVFPFASLKQGKMALDAMTILNKAEAQGIRKELIEEIHSHKDGEEAPEIVYTSATSRLGGEHKEDRPLDKLLLGGEVVRNPYSRMEMKVPYDTLSYDIRTKLPIALHLVQNARVGSSSEGTKKLSLYLNEVAENPHALVVFLRNMIDKEAGGSPERMEILDKLSSMIYGVKDQTLAIMMDESLRSPDWKKYIKTDTEEYEDENGKTRKRNIYSAPLPPASYLSNNTETPLIHHLSFIKLSVGRSTAKLKEKPLYIGAFADKLEGHGSNSKPEWGLQRLYDLHLHEKPGFVVGGHMGNAGAMTFYDGSNANTHYPILIQPGWWASSVDTAGKGNVKPGADPGQAIIFMPGNNGEDYMAFPTTSESETRDMHDALMLLRGLELIKKTEKVMKKK